MRNRIGPNIDPWGTPLLMSFHEEVSQFLLKTTCFLFVRYDINQCKALLEKPKLNSLLSRILWDTRSKALLKSKRTNIFDRSLSILDRISSVSLVSAVCVLRFLRNPDWEGSNNLLACRNLRTCLDFFQDLGQST